VSGSPRPRGWVTGLAAAVTTLSAVALGMLGMLGMVLTTAAVAAGAAAATPTTSPVSNLGQAPGIPGAPPLPAACNLSWPAGDWPPKADPQALAHALHQSDLPNTLRESPAQLATNGPNLDQLAVGWPQAGFAEVSAFPAERTTKQSSVDEIVGRSPTPAQATATYLRARNVIFGSCVRHWPGGEGQPRFPIPWAGSGLFAFEQSDQNDHGISTAAVVIVGHRGRFDFELRVGTFVYAAGAPETAPVPTRAQLAAVLTPALRRLAG
jgi:hypothetical protein